MLNALVVPVAVVSGIVAAISGFGIGSLLTPLLAVELDTNLAVAAVAIPHAMATAVRLWLLRADVHRGVLRSFGVMSAAGGLCGALLHARASNTALTILFGTLLVLAGTSQLSGFAGRWRLHGAWAWAAGAVSGVFGGMVGNQGGIRSAAMLGFGMTRSEFVATGAAIALLIDAARAPVYLFTHGDELIRMWPLLALATAGTIAGTFAGTQILGRISEWTFRQAVGATVLGLGIATLLSAS